MKKKMIFTMYQTRQHFLPTSILNINHWNKMSDQKCIHRPKSKLIIKKAHAKVKPIKESLYSDS